MYREIKGGTCEVIYDSYPCWIPPVPPHNEILFHEYPKEEQYWRRPTIPESFKELFREEREIREQEREMVDKGEKKKVSYVNPILERFRRQEFKRRLWGVWFYNNGKPVYLVGHHYWYLTYCMADNGYPNYYEFSRKAFYFRQYSEEDPFGLGYMIIASRGCGKSQEELACIMNNMTMRHNATAVLQSKNFEEDAKGVLFSKKLVLLFNSLPDFFKPVNSHGTNPKNEFTFNRKADTSKNARNVEFGEDFELNSTIFPVLPGNMALDSQTIQEVFEDEIGKVNTAIADVYERHKVNLKVVYRNHKKIGLLRKTSTVEKMTVGGAECFKLWKDSDPKKRDANGQTISKINRLFISALDTDTVDKDVTLPNGTVIPAACDRYGHVNRTIANQKIQAALDLIKHDYVAMSSEMRKNPRHEAEAFIKDQSSSIFNIQFLTDRLNEIRNQMTRVPYTTGNLYWLDKKFGPVGFKPDSHAGRFNFAWFPDEFRANQMDPKAWKMLNNIGEEWGFDIRGESRLLKFPKNDHLFRIGTDPIKYSKTKDPRASKAAIHGFRMFDQADLYKAKDKWESHNFIFEYCCRPEDPETYLEDMAMACIFLGCTILPERNIPAANTYFEQNGLHRFLAYPKDFWTSEVDFQTNSEDAGYASTPEIIDHYTRRLIKFINEHIRRMPFDNTIEDWLDFDSSSPTKSHATVSSGFTLMHVEKIGTAPEEEGEGDGEPMFPQGDNSGPVGRWIERNEAA